MMLLFVDISVVAPKVTVDVAVAVEVVGASLVAVNLKVIVDVAPKVRTAVFDVADKITVVGYISVAVVVTTLFAADLTVIV